MIASLENINIEILSRDMPFDQIGNLVRMSQVRGQSTGKIFLNSKHRGKNKRKREARSMAIFYSSFGFSWKSRCTRAIVSSFISDNARSGRQQYGERQINVRAGTMPRVYFRFPQRCSLHLIIS